MLRVVDGTPKDRITAGGTDEGEAPECSSRT